MFLFSCHRAPGDEEAQGENLITTNGNRQERVTGEGLPEVWGGTGLGAVSRFGVQQTCLLSARRGLSRTSVMLALHPYQGSLYLLTVAALWTATASSRRP